MKLFVSGLACLIFLSLVMESESQFQLPQLLRNLLSQVPRLNLPKPPRVLPAPTLPPLGKQPQLIDPFWWIPVRTTRKPVATTRAPIPTIICTNTYYDCFACRTPCLERCEDLWAPFDRGNSMRRFRNYNRLYDRVVNVCNL